MFTYDNPIVNFFSKVLHLIMLGFYWIITSIPIITLGASTAAMYRTAAKVIKYDDGTVTREYFQCFKENLKSGIKLTALHLLLLALLGIFFLGCSLMEEGSFVRRLYWAFGLLLAVVFLAVSSYLYPLFSRFQFKTFQYFRAGLYLTFRHPLKSILLLVSPSLMSVILLLNPVFLILYPSVCAYCSVLILEPVFKKYMVKAEDGSDDDTWYWT